VSDENGVWVGTNNLNDDGSLQAGSKVNSLYKSPRTSPGSAPCRPIDLEHLQGRGRGDMNRLSRNHRGPWRIPQLVYNSGSTAWYPEQIIESGGEIYAVLKNFFNDPLNLPGNRVWELHQWDSNAGQFNKVCDIVSGAGWDQVHAFVYSGTLYVVRSGNQTPLVLSGKPGLRAAAIGEAMGQNRLVSIGAASSVGNVPGVCIYNLDGGSGTRQPTPAGTAEGLMADYITTLYSDRQAHVHRPRAAAFNIYDHGEFAINEIDDLAQPSGSSRMQRQEYIQMYRLLSSKTVTSRVRLFPNGEKIVHDQGRVWALIGEATAGPSPFVSTAWPPGTSARTETATGTPRKPGRTGTMSSVSPCRTGRRLLAVGRSTPSAHALGLKYSCR
jgi:hypothetical protein